MQSDDLQQRIVELENRLKEVETRVQQGEIESAYVFIHSNWGLIRWYLTREQDLHGEGSDTYNRARNAEMTLRDNLSRNLRAVQFDSRPMEVAQRWRVETTVTLNRNGYTFFD